MQSKIVFREMLSELKALADVQGNYLTKEDIKKFFPGDALNEEQFGLVCEYLVSQKIKVDGYEPAQKTPETAQKTVREHAERASASNPETEKQEENSETQDGEGPDFLGMYLEELAEIEKLSETEEERLFFEAVNGDSMAKSTLAGQYLETVYELAMTYVASELPIEDLVQEGNIGLLLALENLEAILDVMDQIQDEKHLRMIFDASNLLEFPDTTNQYAYWSEWLNEAGKYIEAMHIKDFRLDENGQYCPTLLGEGVIQYQAISEWLHKNRPDMYLLREEMNPQTDKKDIEYLKNL